MDFKHVWQNLGLLLVLGIALLVPTACSTSGVGPQAWLDYPKDGTLVNVGTPINVLAHVAASDGIADVLLSVNGAAYRRSPPTQTGDLLVSSHEWTPDRAGEYTLEIIAYAKSGEASTPARAHVRALGKATPTPPRSVGTTVTPVPNISPTRGSSADLELVSVEAIVVGSKNGTPFCDVRVTYRNAGTIPIPNDYTIQASLDGRPFATIDRGRGFGVGGTSQATFAYQFIGTAYIGITLDATNAIAESNEANNAFAEARVCGTPSGSVTASPTTTLPLITIVPTRTPTLTPTAITPAQINFRAEQTTITRGQCTTLRWDVENASAVYLDGNGVQGHATQQVCPTSSTTYTLRVNAPAGNVERQLTITVQVPAITATPTKVQDTQGPPAPVLVSPRGTFSSCRTSVTLDWNAVSDASGIKQYIVKWTRDDGQSGGTTTASTQHTITLTCDNKSHTYTWSVQAEDNAGNRGATSSATFTNPAGLY